MAARLPRIPLAGGKLPQVTPRGQSTGQKAPSLPALTAYLLVGGVALWLPESTYNDAQVIKGVHATTSFLWGTVFRLSVWTVAAHWWVRGFQAVRVEAGKTLPPAYLSHAVTGVGLMALLAAWCKPLLSVDTLYYVAYGRQLTILGVNPYEHNLYVSARDPLISQVSQMWFHNIAFYGPLALAMYSLPSLLLPAPTLLGLAVCLKFFWLPFYALLGWLALSYWRERPDRLARAVAITSSPALLWYGLVDGHVDIVIAFFLALTAYFLKENRPASSALSLAAAASLKIVGIVALPVCFCWWLNRSLKRTAIFSATFLSLYGGLYAAVNGGEYRAVIEFTKLWDNLEAANLVPRLLSHLPLALPQVQTASNLTFYATVACVGLLTWRGWFGDDPALPMGWAMGALFLTRTYFQPWYSLWFWPLLWFSSKRPEDFSMQYYLWVLTVLAAWPLSWTWKGYLIGALALLSLLLATFASRSCKKQGQPD